MGTEHETTEETFRRRMKVIRKRLGMSQRELADKAGMAQPTLARLERGERHVTLDEAERLSAALEVPRSYLSDPGDYAARELVREIIRRDSTALAQLLDIEPGGSLTLPPEGDDR